MGRRRGADELIEQARAEEARLRLDVLKLRRKALATYRAAERSRLTRDWNAPTGTADQALIPDLPTLHARARQMVRDDAYAAAVVRALVRNVVGRGIAVSPARLRADSSLDERWNREILALWDSWSSDPALVDVEGKRTVSQYLRWCVAELCGPGDAFILMASEDREGRAPGLMLQPIEAEQLDLTKTENEGRPVVAGVEVSGVGRALRYWISTSQRVGVFSLALPGDSRSFEAARVLHFMDPERAHQTRGASRLASVLTRLRHLGEYDYAQLVAARAEACLGIVIESPTADLELGPLPGQDAEQAAGDELGLLPWTVARLAPGEKVSPFTPTRPNGQYAAFLRAQLHAVGAGVGVSYQQVARDYAEGSYSSQRQAMLEDWREWRTLQDLLVCQVMRPLWRAFVSSAVAGGLIEAPGFAAESESYMAARFAPDGHEWIDPKAEAEAVSMALSLDLDTRERVLQARGLDWRAVARQRAAESAYDAELGLVSSAEGVGDAE